MQTIIWDVDDVLNNLTRDWFEGYWLKNNPACMVLFAQIDKIPPHEIFHISREKYLETLDEFRIKHGESLQPDMDVLEWFRAHGHQFRHAVLTATPRFYAPCSAQWVFKHFGDWIRTYHFVPSKRTHDDFPCYDANKAGFLRTLGNVDIFIDDNESHINDAKKDGIRTLLFPQPWNSNSSESVVDFLKKIIV
ncbi:MAG TPA: hypothetical protein PKW80_13280 [Bacteroidales bacterium]|nr:hypothetical protein [Bacteroidales bacterium]